MQTCRICNRKHHTSICDKEQFLIDHKRKQSISKHVVLIKVDGIACRVLLDTPPVRSYLSAFLVSKLNKQPVKRESKKMEMMLYTATTNINIHDVQIENLQSEFAFKTEVNTVDKDVLLTVPNPSYKSTLSDYRQLKCVKMNQFQTKAVLHIHVILGASDFTIIIRNRKIVWNVAWIEYYLRLNFTFRSY